MNGSMVPMRTLIIAAACIVGFLFLMGYFHWEPHNYRCIDSKRPYGNWVTVFAVGKFEVRLKPYGCTEDNRYDPRTNELWIAPTQKLGG